MTQQAPHTTLLERARSGDAIALEQRVRAYHDRVHRFGLRACRDAFDAEDAIRAERVHAPPASVRASGAPSESAPRPTRSASSELAPDVALERFRLVHAVHQAIAALDAACTDGRCASPASGRLTRTMRPSLPDDAAFVARMIANVRSTGLMRDPQLDREACQLVEGGLRLDLLNVWHETRQLSHPDSDEIVAGFLRPKDLAQACYFGRLDLVESAITADLRLDVEERDPIAAALAAFVTTSLHLACIERLFEAGAEPTSAQLDALAESAGSATDVAMMSVLLERAVRSQTPEVRERARQLARASNLGAR